MIPLHLTQRLAARPVPPSCDLHHRRVFMRYTGAHVLTDGGVPVSAGPGYRCGVCGRRTYREVYGI